MSIESSTYSFLQERVAAAPAGSPRAGIEVLPDEFAEIRKEKGVRIGDMLTARVAPKRAYEGVEHLDCVLVLIVYRAVARADRQARQAYRDEVIALAEDLALLFFLEPDMRVLQTGEARVQNSRPLLLPRTSDNLDGKTYAVANIQLVVNETGQIDFTGRR